jgi:TM2 domain-containing membrane protein YozV/predicted transcriptional regulator
MYTTGMAYLLWLLSGFGALGFHRFYLGKAPTGLLWMFTGGLCGLGSLYDLFTLPGQVRQANMRQAIVNGMYQPNVRFVDDGNSHIMRDKNSVERTILHTAKRNAGIVTPSEIALDAGISLEDAKKALDALVKQGIAELRVRKSGNLVYTLPDFMHAEEDLEDF